ncbi:MAG: type VI secretion system contractile sheath large subunit [Planctomycetes bacterium]|nr:type VI secretion system contractile sheath large subunit [Planctomycetota bacterium]
MSDDGKVKGFSSDFGFGSTDHPEVKPLPFRIMAVGDFCGAGRDLERGPVNIDAHDFDAVMAKLGVRAFFEVENELSGADKTLEVDLKLTSIKSFEPTNIAAGIPALGAVSEFIRRAKGVSDGSVKPAEFKQNLSEFQKVPLLREPLEALLEKLGGAPASSEPASDDASGGDAVDAIFDMVDAPKKQTGGSAIDAFAGSLSGGSQKGIDVSGGIALAMAALEKQLKAVTGHEQYKRLEANWRGLHLLCKRGKGAQIELFDGDFDAWQERVYQREYAGTTEAPLGLVVLGDDIENSPAGLEALQQWGDAGGQIQCGVVFNAGQLIGEDMRTLAKRDAPANLFDDPRFDKWRSLRDKDESRWLCAALNGWECAGNWGSPAWLVAVVVAQSMRRTGWPSAHTGAADGEIEQLKTREYDGAEIPLQTTLSDRALKDLSKVGFTPLICQANNDSAWVMLAPTVHKPSKAEEEGKLGTLAYQLLAARMGEMIMRNKGKLIVPGDMQGSAENFAKFLAGMLAESGPGANIDITSQGSTLVLSIRTGRDMLGGAELQLGVNVE